MPGLRTIGRLERPAIMVAATSAPGVTGQNGLPVTEDNRTGSINYTAS
jgi:hypothetical protein